MPVFVRGFSELADELMKMGINGGSEATANKALKAGAEPIYQQMR